MSRTNASTFAAIATARGVYPKSGAPVTKGIDVREAATYRTDKSRRFGAIDHPVVVAQRQGQHLAPHHPAIGRRGGAYLQPRDAKHSHLRCVDDRREPRPADMS